MTAPDGFSVLLLAAPYPHITAVSEALAAARGVPALDTAREARSSWGILGAGLPDADADRLVAELTDRSVPSAKVATASLPTLPPVMAASTIEVSEAGFKCQLAKGATPLIPWASVAFAAAVVLKETTVKVQKHTEGPSQAEVWVKRGIMMATGIPLPVGRSKEVETRRENTELQAVLDVALAKPAGRLRFSAGHFDVTYLGERRVYDSLGNFRLVVADVAARLDAARLNHGAQTLVSNAPLTAMGYASMEEFEREERWLLARPPAP